MTRETGPDGHFTPRRARRVPVERGTQLRPQHWYSIEVQVCDVSTTGFKAECPEPVRIGSYVSLDVPGVGAVSAQVRWQLAGRMGGLFVDPISLNSCEWTAVKADPPLEIA